VGRNRSPPILWILLRPCLAKSVLDNGTEISIRVYKLLTTTKLTALAVICSISTFQPRFRDPYLRPVRAATFGSLAIFTMVPVVHGVQRYGWDIQSQRMGIVWVIITLGLNITGAMAYAFKVCGR
jgi:Haemolysin-III related